MSVLASSFGRGPGHADGGIIDRIADTISRQGYVVLDGAVPPAMLNNLFVHLCGLTDAELKRAGVGRDNDYQLNRFVRTDETCWLETGHPASGDFLAWMELLRLGLRQRLYLGLFDYEAHYARYAPGAYYRKHRDAFGDGRTNRVLSTVLYLNPGWEADDGGEMLLYADDDRTLMERVQPVYGRLAIFLSERFPHEVLPTRRTRYSIAGWFRVNASLGGQIDPPR